MVKLISWNVNGLRAVTKKGFFDWVSQAQPDILGLQETKISGDQLTPELTELPGYHSFWTHAEKRGYSGVCVYTKTKPLQVQEGLGHPEFDTEGRVLALEFDDFWFYNIYYPNGQRSDERLQYKMAFYDAFLTRFNERLKDGKGLIVCGDFNTAHHPIDLARPKENEKVSGFLPIERAWMDTFVSAGYIDTFRVFEKGPNHYSWWNMRSRARERNVGWRIDYFFISPNLLPKLTGADIHADVQGSDHCPVSIELCS
ncbi:MAG: exodeoxyribonuclease III [Cyanobacteria bacterium]|nr:exodeoxyribonuclease III [Cyanobacteriota bacterium]